jgi:toxin FitB
MNLMIHRAGTEYFIEGENADFFAPAIHNAVRLIVPTICIYEVFKRLLAERDEDSALLSLGLMSHGREVELDRTLAIDAAQISYELKLAMADSIILATARAYAATLWTQDEHFKNIEGVKYIGRKPNK